MKKPRVQQKTERRISAGLRLALVAVLLLLQIAVVVALSLLLQQKMALVYTALGLLAVVVAIWVYTRPGSSSYKIGWALLILAVPVAGLILYLLWNSQPVHRSNLKKLPYPPENDERRIHDTQTLAALESELPKWHRVAAYGARRGFAPYSGTDWEYLSTGEAYFEHMFAALEKAEKFIFMEYYIVTRGEIFDRLVDIFRRKREQGVEIKLIFDDFGSMMRFGGEEVGMLRRMGVETKVFNPVHQYVNRLYFNYRNHRKITCIDGHIAYTGGINIADEYANIIDRFGYWKDGGVCISGEAAWGFTREFLRMWERMGGKFPQPYDDYRPAKTVAGKGYCQPFSDGPDNNPVNTAEDIFLHLINRAQHTLRITSPYLAIDEPMLRALCTAGDSGVKVQLMMPGTPDHKFAYLVAETYFGELMRHGVEIYTFTPGFLHGKTVLADNEIAVIGTVNMDYRSFQLHYECGTILYGENARRGLEEDMDAIIAQSRRVTISSWKARPWLRKLTGMFLRLFAMWM